MSARQSVESRFHGVIERAASDYGDHVGITRAKVVRWLSQFPPRSRPLAAKVLVSLTYYADNNIGTMARRLVQATYGEYASIGKNRICFVPIGSPGSGAQQIARHLRSMRDVPRSCVIDLLDLNRRAPTDVEVVVALDDFSGTGETIKEWWDLNEPIIRPKAREIVLGLLVLNCVARPALEGVIERIMPVEELSTSANVFHDECATFTSQEKASLFRLCKKTKCSPAYVKGRGECGLLVVFKHGCPNNSIPILWHERNREWEALFRRRVT